MCGHLLVASGMALKCIFNAATEQNKSPLMPKVHSINSFWFSAHIIHCMERTCQKQVA